MPTRRKRIVVIYHADCPDGFGAAYAAWKKFGARAIYKAVPPNNGHLPKEAWGADVYTLDYSFPSEEVPRIRKRVRSLTTIDHHISNEKSAALATQSFFALDHSGAVLSWMYFHPDRPVPKLLRHIEDGDLWRFKLPHTRELYHAFMIRPKDFRVWDKIVCDMEDKKKLKTCVQEGKLLLMSAQQMVERLAEHVEWVRFAGRWCLMVNSPVYVSEIGHALVERGSPIGIIWSRKGKNIIISLRSNGKVDVSEIAVQHGGGGHKAAAGFSWEEKDFLKFRYDKAR